MREDFDAYHAVLHWAAQRGYLAAFDAVGAQLLAPACGACANCGPGSSTEGTQVTISAIAGELVAFEDLRKRC